MRTLVVGGTKGFGKDLCLEMGPDSLGLGRTNGFDISEESVRLKIIEKSFEFDLVILLAHQSHYQNILLESLYKAWEGRSHEAYLVAIGSIASYFNKYNREDTSWNYISEKNGLSVISKLIAWRVHNLSNPIRFTALHVGMLDCKKSHKHPEYTKGISASELSEYIKYLYSTPKHLCLHEIYLETKYGKKEQ